MYNAHPNERSVYATAIAMLSVFGAFTLAPYALQCRHPETTVNVVTVETCEQDGLEQTLCSKCNTVLEERVLPATGHSFGAYTVISPPAPGKNGIEARLCSSCHYEETREFECPHEYLNRRTILEPTCSEVGIDEAICFTCEEVQYLPIDKIPHAETKSVTVQEPTCSAEGIAHLVCIECEAVADEVPIPVLECNYGDWKISTYATPFESGVRSRECQDCGRELIESYSIELPKNYLYIPEADILCKFTVSSFTQGAVDSCDVVYTKNAYGVTDPSNPFILGHWFGSLTTMWHTPVGAKIYVNIDNNIETYEVLNSEYAVQQKKVYHIGQETGVNVWDAYGSAMNSEYAVFGRYHMGKDLWPEQNDGKTLHMYTCHNKSDRPGWKPEHGGEGRWIILANLIHSVNIETGEVLFEKAPADLTSSQPADVAENTENQPS